MMCMTMIFVKSVHGRRFLPASCAGAAPQPWPASVLPQRPTRAWMLLRPHPHPPEASEEPAPVQRLPASCIWAHGSRSVLHGPAISSAGMWARLTLKGLGWPSLRIKASSSCCMRVTQQMLMSISRQPMRAWYSSQAHKLEVSKGATDHCQILSGDDTRPSSQA